MMAQTEAKRSPLTTLCYLERDGQYLMLHRVSKKNDVNKGKWIGVGGHFEEGESPEECMLREVFEETHLRVKNLRFYKSQPWPFSDSLLFGFFCDLDGDDHIIIEEEELAMAKWISPEEVFEENNDYSLTNEMLCKFKEDYGTK